MALSRLDNSGARRALAAVLVLAPPLVPLLGAGDPRSLAALVPTSGLVAYALVLGAGILTYFHWRVVAAQASGELAAPVAPWLALGLIASGVSGLLQQGPLRVVTDTGSNHWPVVGQIVIVLFLCTMALVVERADVPADPALLGTLAAAVLSATSYVLMRSAPPLALTHSESVVLNSGLFLGGLALAWIVLHLSEPSPGSRRNMALAVVLLTGAQCASNIDHDVYLLQCAAITAYLLGAVALCTMTQRLLQSSVLEHQAELDDLQRSLAEVRVAVREGRELLHEVGATLAGITTASQVMRHGMAVPAHRRRRLETMLDAELSRLGRLMEARSTGTTQVGDCELDIDAAVEPLVTSHRTRGHDVRWVGCGERAVGDPDELAELLNILLENASRHSGGGVVRLSVSAHDGGIVVICSDNGNGVPRELRDRLFEPDVRRPGSPGQGLGLAIAHRLVTARGGSLELADRDGPGATFVARLPPELRRGALDDAACHIA